MESLKHIASYLRSRTPAGVAALFATLLSACSGGGSGAPAPAATASPSPFIAFVPSSISVRSSRYDFFGELTYTAREGYVPRPVSPANGSLACDKGYSVLLRIAQGPAPIGIVHDEYLVLPLSARVPQGTTLTCTATWGLYNGSTLVAKAPLTATLTYDAGQPAIFFSPAALSLKSSAGKASAELAYVAGTGLKAKPVSPASGALTCAGHYTLTPAIRAGSVLQGYEQDRFVIDPAAVTPKPAKGTTLRCATTWGAADAAGNVVQVATLTVALFYDTKP